MDPLAKLIHLLGFIGPAVALALLLPLVPVGDAPRRRGLRAYGRAALVLFVVGAAVLACGLWYFGVDGKMATYGALVGLTASAQWVLARGWR